MNFADKACPLVFRDSSMRQILAFEHLQAGLQIVKGSIEPGEHPRIAALPETWTHRCPDDAGGDNANKP